MDPHKHQLNQMDPKLKEAYDRVMNKPTQPVTAKPDLPSPGLNNAHPTLVTPTQSVPSIQPKMVTEAIPDQNPIPQSVAPKEEQTRAAPPLPSAFIPANKPHQATGTVHIGYSAKPGQKMNLEKKKLHIPPALYIVGCALFFILYAIFWVKVFGLKIPFLP